MYSYPFNPLRKPLDNVAAEDLVRLREVAEGWYVDYKSEGLGISDLAKHISAFANQYGGWLYFGVKEANDGSRRAGTFPGIPTEDAQALSLRIREAISTHVSPPLLYEERVIGGPCEAIGLPEGRAVLIVGIPQGVDPPYIHSSGRIFRRLSDQSKPEAEKDRHALDILFERGKRYREKITERLRRTPELRREQSDSPFVFVYLTSDLRLPEAGKILSMAKFRDICRNKDGAQSPISVPLDQVRAADFGFIARQVIDNDPEFAGLGIRWWHQGVARLDIPVNVWPGDEFQMRTPKYKHSEAFADELAAQHLSSRGVCDFAFLVQAVATLTNVFFLLRECTGDFRPAYAACELRNLFYRVPFFNSAAYINKCREDGIPLLTERTIVFPERPYFDNMFLLLDPLAGNGENVPDPIAPAFLPYFRVVGLLSWMLSATGIIAETEELFDGELYVHPHTSTSAGINNPGSGPS